MNQTNAFFVMHQESAATFSNPTIVIMQCLPLICVVLAIIATVRCVRTGRQGWVLVLWMMFIWLVPLLGPSMAILALWNSPAVMLRKSNIR